MTIRKQLELVGLEETVRRVTAGTGSSLQRKRAMEEVLSVHQIHSSLPTEAELSFLHSGLAQTCLPHSRPDDDSALWSRSSGGFSLTVAPGSLMDKATGKARYVGVPYGSRARLIMVYLQTEGVKSRVVSLGPNLSAFLRSIGVNAVTGGPRGSITSVREQCLRIARATFSMQWSGPSGAGQRDIVRDTRIAEGLELWTNANGQEWTGTVELSRSFQEHLREHAVPLDRRAIARLADNSLSLDLYTLFAYRLPRLQSGPICLRWSILQQQIGTTYARMRKLHEKVREVLPEVLDSYPGARVEATSSGLVLYPSPRAVPEKTIVQGMKLISAG